MKQLYVFDALKSHPGTYVYTVAHARIKRDARGNRVFGQSAECRRETRILHVNFGARATHA